MNHPHFVSKGLHAILGVVLPASFVGLGVVAYFVAQKPEAGKVAALGSDMASLLSVMPAAQVESVRALTESLDIAASGVVVPYREIQVASEVGGRVLEKDVNMRPGNHVLKGQLLLKIDPRDYQYEIDRLTQRLDQERALVKESEQELQNTQRLIELAQSQLELAEADFKRTASLDTNFASQAELGASKQQMLNAMNQKVTLQNQADAIRTRRQRLDAAIKLVETELQQAEVNLRRTEISSPVDGLIVKEQVETDSYVQRGTQLMTIEDISKAEISCNLRMDQLYWLLDQNINSRDSGLNASFASLQKPPQVQAIVRFKLGGRESLLYEWEGRLDRFEGTGLDPQNRMIPMRVVVDRPSEYRINGLASVDQSLSLVRGMFVDVVLKAKPATQLLLVPKLSVKPATDSRRIWKFEPDPRAIEVVQKRHGIQELTSDDSDSAIKSASQDRPSADRPRLVSDRAGESNESDTGDSAESEKNTQETAEAPKKLDPDQWQCGFLRVLDGIEVIGVYQDPNDNHREYLICDVSRSGLQPGDYVVVTPLPGIESSDEPIRVAKENLKSVP
jgi:multidrug efflux pump subunit AcrA (membrane-fusion protein)